MINLVLDNLRHPTSEGFDSDFEFCGLPSNFNSLITFAFVGDAQQRKTSFFDIITALTF